MKKGFTLIEMLLVIGLLAIVTIITVPTIIGVIQNARKDSYLESVRKLVHAVEIEQTQNNDVDKYVLNDKKLSPNVIVKSIVDGSGTITFDEQKNINVRIGNDKWCVYKSFSDSIYYIDEKPCDKVEVVENSDKSGAFVPQLDSTMVPIVWNGGHLVKADERNPAGANKWYDYNASMWANIAVIKTSKKEEYKKLEVGKTINPDDVISYLVWIPRFEYQVPSGGPKQIQVNFKQFKDAVTAGFTVHPAFTWGSTNIRGFWMGKFETTGTLDRLTVLPGKNILKGTSVNIQSMYNAVKKINDIKKKDEYKSQFAEIHLIKNVEWGATAYLSQSKYGRCKDNNCSDVAKSSNVNLTGYGPSNKTYDTAVGMTASTTGTIYGVYDMVGGTWEYVMGSNNIERTFGSEKIPNEYYDNYKGITDGIKGDATIETKGWYGAGATYPQASDFRHFFIRGGDTNTADAGLFFYGVDSGAGGFRNGYRLAIAPEETIS